MTQRTERPDDERRATYLKASQMARDLGTHFLQRMPLDDAAGALMAAGASLMAAAMGAELTAGYLRTLAEQIETSRPPQPLN